MKRKLGGLIKDLSGQVFGRLTVISFSHTENGSSFWNVICSCGETRTMKGNHLKTGNNKSCGCLMSFQSCRQRYSKVGSAFRSVLHQYVDSAKRFGRQFSLSSDQFKTIVTSKCHYCGKAPSRVSESRAGEVFVWNGVDRLKNDFGYTPDNSVACCRWCNVAKNSFSKEEFVKKCVEVAVRSGLCQKT